MASASLGKLAKPFAPQLAKVDSFACATLDGVTNYTQTSLASGRSALASVVDVALLPSLSDIFSSPIESTLVTAERLFPEPAPATAEAALPTQPAAAVPASRTRCETSSPTS